MTLRELLAKLPAELIPTIAPDYPGLDQAVTGLCTNSKTCQPGNLFIGMPGTRVDGGEFWPSALEKGAIAAIISPNACQKQPATDASTLLIPVDDIPTVCGELAAAFYNYPGKTLNLVGVTGTNGKTTTTHVIEHFLNAAEIPTGLLGTLYTRWPGHQETAVHTTPFPVDLQRELAKVVSAGCQHAVMEVSSHALDQKRVWGCPFAVSVFTNLTQDHLDYHKNLNDYFEAKALLFSPDYLKGRAIINSRDPYGQKLINRLSPEQVWTYHIDDLAADLHTTDLTYSAAGVRGSLITPMGSAPFTSPLVGRFNLENLLAAAGAVLHLGVSLESLIAALAAFGGVPGRMERVQVSPAQDISVIVDYAHTPDSLENALRAARPFITGQMICVFGCGGDRDRTKRPQMGRIAYELADRVVVTSDNPRTEDPQQILTDVVAGIEAELNEDEVICDRAAAIQHAILTAQPGDGVLIAGKGHEDYQILGTEKIHFDDREQSQLALKQRLAS
ncbi:udp-n-acetylmuramoylalanyl-d-glutamate-- -diaminopimelate ligase [Leptolyngbya sp. Heron Island J]|uniref:UDP-N-acetylmuramoyl-L-alanyl-D-glutamate--2, 6-diaminopimelate ligase n=1 Tax=Leptolyngbya sp. Heron Island J TaxID=1385935 RepID=UPI0003B94A54|nr:UDP-N-acetylmuramoyl-L-alanyl-D-glutamate--2,6-diaminopimelate ligase [Leptolyngbya sp. Heron Island J]ESA33554.1 udp-n-acetylmuramoylalanyl-d-glutamate-- -diaminopimelate ligase [Leptolyngbya sp. Heron Island J]